MRSMHALVLIIAAGGLAACIKTEDHLRDLVTKHSDLVDPSSAMFRNLTFKGGDYTDTETWCGEINAKNQMAGYFGWIPFHVKAYQDGKVFVDLLTPTRLSDTETDRKLAKLDEELHEIYCRDAQPAPAWVPFWTENRVFLRPH